MCAYVRVRVPRLCALFERPRQDLFPIEVCSRGLPRAIDVNYPHKQRNQTTPTHAHRTQVHTHTYTYTGRMQRTRERAKCAISVIAALHVDATARRRDSHNGRTFGQQRAHIQKHRHARTHTHTYARTQIRILEPCVPHCGTFIK